MQRYQRNTSESTSGLTMVQPTQPSILRRESTAILGLFSPRTVMTVGRDYSAQMSSTLGHLVSGLLLLAQLLHLWRSTHPQLLLRSNFVKTTHASEHETRITP